MSKLSVDRLLTALCVVVIGVCIACAFAFPDLAGVFTVLAAFLVYQVVRTTLHDRRLQRDFRSVPPTNPPTEDRNDR